MPEAEEVTTMPLVAAEQPIIPLMPPVTSNPTPLAPKQASTAISDYIKPTLIRYPMYSYQTGRQWFLSKTERIIVDAYLKTNNESEACRALNAIRTAHGSSKLYNMKAIHRWLTKPHVATYVGERFQAEGKVNWMDETKWKSWNVDVLLGKLPATTVQMSAWKEYGKAQGWYKDVSAPQQTNVQINFTQNDGRA